MPLELAPLPYAADALAPHVSERTMSFHYGRHHAGYVANLNKMIAGTAREHSTLEEIVARADAGSALFNNAAQAWNHAFYWQSMTPGGGGQPTGGLAAAVEASFGSADAFAERFAAAATSNFGSGWTWLVVADGASTTGDDSGADGVAVGHGSLGGFGPGGGSDAGLMIVNTDDADTPVRHGQTPLLTIDVWEHAYYLDYQNARAAYVDAFVEHLLNWEFAARNWEQHRQGRAPTSSR